MQCHLNIKAKGDRLTPVRVPRRFSFGVGFLTGLAATAIVIVALPVARSPGLAMVDVTYSMHGHESEAKKYVAKMRPPVLQIGTHGFGVAHEGDPQNLLHSIEMALRANPEVEEIHVVSDFDASTATFDDSDQAGYNDLRKALAAGKSRKLYLHTVNRRPPAQLEEIARNSGGGT